MVGQTKEAFMSRAFLAVAVVILAPLAAFAQNRTAYEGSSYGTGSGKCSGYRMGVNVTVAGDRIDGIFQQEGRPQREFHAKAEPNGRFKTEAQVGGGGTMSVTGTVQPNGGHVLLDGYCRFDTALAPKQ
jgi:hypothetical protein